MALKVFQAQHREEKGNEIVRYFEKKQDGSHLYVMVLLPVAADIANSIMLRLQQVLYDMLFGEEAGENAEDNFENALKVINEDIGNILDEEAAETILRQGAMLLAFQNEEELLVTVFGQGEVFLLREGQLMEITDGISPTRVANEFFQNVSSGELQSGDKMVFSTFRLQRFMTEKQLAMILGDGVTEAMESIKTLIDSTENGNVMILNYKSDDMLKLPEIGTPGRGSVFAGAAAKSSGPDIMDILGDWQKKIIDLFGGMSKNRLLAVMAGVVGVVLIFLFFGLLSGNSSTNSNQEFADFVENFEQEMALVGTREIEGEIDQANRILNRNEETAREMIQKRVDIDNAYRILEELAVKREELNDVTRIGNPETMTDLSPIIDGGTAQGILFSNNEFLVHDADSLYRILVSTENPESLGTVVANGEIAASTPFPGKDNVVFYTDTGSIVEYENGQSSTANTADSTWKNADDIATFSKFLYFLDSTANQIWKYERRESGYTTAEGWLTGSGSLKDAVSFAIDGNIFVLTSKGEIQKYYRGEQVPYETRNVPGGMVSGDVLYTDENLNQIFVLSKAENRILIFSKEDTEAVYRQQLIIEETEPIVDIFARDNVLYALGEQQVYKIPLSGS
jgi:hypothetical protein